MGINNKYKLKNNKALIIREAEPCDAKDLIQYINKVAGESDNLTFGEGEFNVNVEQEKKIIQNSLNSPRDLFLIAEVDGRIVGNLTFRSGKRPRTKHSGEFGITVLKKYWGLGIGKLLMKTLLDWAKSEGQIKKINLRVRFDNHKAIKLYEKMGFEKEGKIKRGFLVNGKFIDIIAMGICLD
ncbi:GNAT family N-acetyltransferase [Thermohalobacter berrensis]|uniref:GNAT family N-acetyltransferase n=1 Tax=Thermohalobacter berrensis TaxID=99594 RepID=A0A419TA00_9FIRM|nr:GNAT family N-acetyltransferase [Thermohalobacter berrensis]RKD34277.1 GNAT family N-acetyltransferase [Thermohalobacter berrensis]